MARQPTLPSLAAAIAEWFPELGGRSLAVSETEPFDDKTNVPTLPLAVVGMLTGRNENPSNGGNARVNLQDDVLLQFVFEPEKYKRQDGNDSPFFAFYDYESIRDRLIVGLRQWRTPRGGAITYRSIDVESDEFAVWLSFRLEINETWCAPDPEEACGPLVSAPVVDVMFSVQAARSECCSEVEPCPTPDDPCDAARKRNPYGKEAQEEA